MTPEKNEQWNKFACVPRCLMKLAEKSGNVLTKEQFCERFKDAFSDPDESLGLLSDAGFQAPLAPVGLPTDVRKTDDYSLVQKDFDKGKRKVLILSEINLNPGKPTRLSTAASLHELTMLGFLFGTPTRAVPTGHWI